MNKVIVVLAFCLPLGLIAQPFKISHPGSLNGNWFYSPKSTELDYSTVYVSPEGVKNPGQLKNPIQVNDYDTSLESQDQLAQLFINYSSEGGATVKATNGLADDFYGSYIGDIEYNEYLQSMQTTGQQISRSDYFKSKYGNRLPANFLEGTISGYRAIYYLAKTEQDNEAASRVYNFFVFLDNQNGILITGGEKYREGKSTQSLEEIEKILFQHINELQFTKAEGELNGTTVSTPTDTIPGSEDSNIPWTIIIGAVSAAVVAAIVRKLLKKDPSKTQSKNNNQDKKNEEEPAEYILQLNKDSFSLSLNQPDTLQVQVWKVTTKGKAPVSASINIQNPEKNLKITSQSAENGLTSVLLLEKQATQPQFNLMVTATAEGKSIQKTVLINYGGKMQIAIETLPDNKRFLRPDTNKTLTCLAEVLDENGKSVPSLTKKIQFKPQSKWIDLSDPVWDDKINKIAINIAASNPDQVSAASHIPKNITLSLIMDDVKENEAVLQNDLVVELLDCKIDTDVSQCTFPVSENQTEIKIKAFIENPGDEPWTFEAEYKKVTTKDEPLSQISIIKKLDTEAIILLTGPIAKPDARETSLSKTLVISAYQDKEKPIERHIPVMVSQIGLFIKHGLDDGNQISFLAQGPFECNIEFVLYKQDKNTNEIVVGKEGLKELKFELKEDAKDILNFASVLDVSYTFSDLIGNVPYGRYKLKTEEQMPGFGDVFTLTYLVQAPCSVDENPEHFQLELPLKVKTYGIGSEFPEWQEAYDNCRKVILHFVPSGATQSKLYDLLEARKFTLGAEGLNQLRKRIWKVAYNLILAKGAEGYKKEANWANYITETLAWTEWAGEIAFNALVGYFIRNPAASVATNMSRSFMIEALNFYIYEDKPIEDFIDLQYSKIVPLLLSVSKGRLISIENIEMVVKQNKPLATGIFVSCEFIYNLYQTKSVVEAAKLTAAQLRDEFIIRKLTLHLHKEQLKYKIKLTTVHESLEDIVKSIKTKDGKEYIEVDKLMEIMRDPAKVRTIKNHAPDWLKKVFDNSRSEIYNKHDSDLKKFIAEKYKIDPNDVKIDDFRTPGTGDSYNLNTDRDFRVLRKTKTADGKDVWIELQRNNWIDQSYESFGKLTGKPYGISPKEWAEKHLQRGTDRFDAEASKDYSDHVFNADTGEVIKGNPNIVKVKHGEGTLYDAEGLGKMYENKVKNALEPGTIPEAYAQAQKAVDTLKKVKQSYADQSLDVKPTSEKLKNAMEVISSAKTDVQATPQEIQNLNNKLQKLGYKDVGEVANDIAKEFQGLKKHDNPSQVFKVS